MTEPACSICYGSGVLGKFMRNGAVLQCVCKRLGMGIGDVVKFVRVHSEGTDIGLARILDFTHYGGKVAGDFFRVKVRDLKTGTTITLDPRVVTMADPISVLSTLGNP